MTDKKTSIIKNYLYHVSYKLLVILLPILTTPYLARILGPSNTGIYSYTISITTYFILFGTLGISLYGQRAIAYENSKKKQSIIFWELIILKGIAMVFSTFFFYMFYIRTGAYSIYYKILLLELLANLIDINWFYQGLEIFKVSTIRYTIVKLLSVIAIFSFVKSEADLPIYFLIYAFQTFCSSVSLWIGLKKYLVKVTFKELNIRSKIVPIIIVFIPQISVQLYTVLDKTMIGMITKNMMEVGYYEESEKIIKTILTIITSLSAVMLPRISKFYKNKEKKNIETCMYKSISFVYLLSFPIMLGIIAIKDQFVPLFLGEGYEAVKILLPLLSPIILFIGLSNIFGIQYLLGTEQEKSFTLSVVGGAAVNLIMNSLLISKFQSIGAVISTVVAEFTVLSIQLYILKKDFSLKKIVGLAKKYAIASIGMFLICMGVKQMDLSSFVSLCLVILIGIGSYFIFLYFLKDELILSYIKKTKHKENCESIHY